MKTQNNINCRFCKIISENSEKVIREGKHIFVVLSNPKLVDGHLLVIPKRHIEKLSELSKEEQEELFNETIELQERILEKIAPGCDISQHYRPFITDNKYKVTHLHVHIRPRHPDDELHLKVQKFEKEVFKDITASEVEKYRELLN